MSLTGYMKEKSRRISAISDTRIKYLLVADKIYNVTSINWMHFSLEAKETDLFVGGVPESEVWDISYFEDFKIRLVNGSGVEIINFEEWTRKNMRD